MLKLRNFLILIIMMLATMSASAAFTANDVLTRTSQKFNSAKSLSANFTAVANDGKSTKGNLLIAHEKFSLISEGYGVWYDGTDMWSYYKDSGETSLTEPTQSELLEINPLLIVNQYSKKFKATLISHKGGNYVVQLTPLKADNSIKKAVLTISEKTWLPSAITVTFANNSTLKITINSISESKTAPQKSSFQYPASKYPGVEVIDLR